MPARWRFSSLRCRSLSLAESCNASATASAACSAPLIARYTPEENTGSRNAKASPTNTHPGPPHLLGVVRVVTRDAHFISDQSGMFQAPP